MQYIKGFMRVVFHKSFFVFSVGGRKNKKFRGIFRAKHVEIQDIGEYKPSLLLYKVFFLHFLLFLT